MTSNPIEECQREVGTHGTDRSVPSKRKKHNNYLKSAKTLPGTLPPCKANFGANAPREQAGGSYCRLGRIQRQCRRAVIAKPGASFTTAELGAWAYPRLATIGRHQRRALRRAADRFLIRIGRRGRELVWAAK
jgi:hypothetical protein